MTSATTALQNLPKHKRLQRLEALVIASESLNRAASLDDILQAILELIPAQLDCDRATVFLSDRRTGKIHARRMAGSRHLEIILEKGTGLAGYVTETGESLLINDVQTDERFDRTTDMRTGYRTETMLCVPLRKSEDEILGALQAINARRGEFTEEDLVYLESFAAVAAVAVEREQLTQEAMRAHRLTTELELARKIQQRLLPSPGNINLPEPYCAWGHSQACYDVGGDTYDALMLPGGECAFWVADVSGKGIGAALLMTTLQTELRALVRAEHDLGKLATELNSRVDAVTPLGTYATMFLGIVNADRNRMRFVNAGHLPPFWLYANDAQERNLEAGEMPIGLLPGTTYETNETEFKAGERLVLFSDGVTDAENTKGEQYDFERLYACREKINQHEVSKIGAALLSDLDRFRIGAPNYDDTTYLIVGH